MTRLMLVVAAVLGGAGLGTVAGHATVSGMRADATVTERLAGAYGVPEGTDALDDLSADPAEDAVAMPAALDSGGDSDWTEGYRWARRLALRHATTCAVDSWSFQRGCEAAIRDRAAEAI